MMRGPSPVQVDVGGSEAAGPGKPILCWPTSALRAMSPYHVPGLPCAASYVTPLVPLWAHLCKFASGPSSTSLRYDRHERHLDQLPAYPCAKLKLDQLFLQWLSEHQDTVSCLPRSTTFPMGGAWPSA